MTSGGRLLTPRFQCIAIMPATPLSITLQDVAIQLNDPCRITLFKPAEPLSKVLLPLFTSKIPAGFPSPANDYIEKNLDLNELMIQNPAATFFARAQGLIPTTNIIDTAL